MKTVRMIRLTNMFHSGRRRRRSSTSSNDDDDNGDDCVGSDKDIGGIVRA